MIGTLAVTEASQAVFLPDRRPSQASEDKDYKKSDDLAIITEERYVTSSLRASLRHVYRIAGVTSFLRGMAVNLCYVVTTGMFMTSIIVPIKLKAFGTDQAKITQGIAGNKWRMVLAEYAAEFACVLLLCSWGAVHTHIIITPPTLRIWYRRLPPFFKTVKTVWLAEMAGLVAHTIAFELPVNIYRQAGIYDRTAYLGPLASGNALLLRRLTFVAIWAAAQLARVELVVPSGVVLARIQTSLLADDEDTVIPVDRSFGTAGAGREKQGVKGFMPPPPGILAQARAPLGFLQAWRSYGLKERKRILLLYAKFVVVEVVIRAAFWSVLGGEEVWPTLWNPSL